MVRKETRIQYIERLKMLLQTRKTECQEMYLPTPTRIFKTGDRVEYGRWEWSHVLEVFGGWKYYKVLNITPNVSYGVQKGYNFEITYLPWITLSPYRTIEQKKSPPKLIRNEDLRLNFSQRDVYSLVHMFYYAGLDLNPDYQRGNVWSKEDKVLLIDSIFKNIDIGKFTIIRRPFSGNEELYEILDGKQRVTALLEFYEDRFSYKGLRFSEMHWRDQHHFENYHLSFAQAEPMSDEQKYRYFLNLNITGKPVDPNHINHVKQLLKTERGEKQ